MLFFTNRAIWLWLLMGGLGYIALPWFAIQDTNGLLAIPQVFGGEKTGNGLVHAALFGRPWLWLGLVGLVVVENPATACRAGLRAGRPTAWHPRV